MLWGVMKMGRSSRRREVCHFAGTLSQTLLETPVGNACKMVEGWVRLGSPSYGQLASSSWRTATIPMENPYCSCKLPLYG